MGILGLPPDAPFTLNGIRIFASEAMPTDMIEDWSQVRSPSRAARRRRQGHPQRIGYREEPRREVVYMEARNAMFMHPVVLAEFKAALARRPADADPWQAVRAALVEVGCQRASEGLL